MRRLSGTDALFLSTETPAWHQHVGGLTIVDPAESDRFSFDAVRDMTRDRIRLVPKYTWKLKEVPLHLDRAVWVEDPDFDISRHFRRIAVPPPGGRREVGDLVGQLMSYQLDRRRPLWEMWYVDGVVGGQVAVIMKYHHCLMDGISGAGLAEQLVDLEPDPPARAAAADIAVAHDGEAGPRVPSDLELVARALIPTLRIPRNVLTYAARSAMRGITMLQQRGTNPMAMGTAGPCFNRPVGPHRQQAFVSVSLDDVRALKDHFGVKLNDIILALVSGSLRRHMARHGDAPAQGSLVASVPVSTRVADENEPSNKVAAMAASLATDIEDPVERVHAIHRSTQSAKELTEAVRARRIQSVGEVAPPLLINLASRAAWAANVARVIPVVQNLIVSNIPGPPIPLYMCGARLTGMYASSVLLMYAGLNITLMSYVDRVDFGLTSDPDLLDDPWEVADGIQVALTELMDAAGLGKPSEVHDPFDR
jgi:WS/DGAT/MGAT family acyltransferase